MRKVLGCLLLLWSSVSFAQLYFVRDNTGQLYTVNTSTGAATLVAALPGFLSSTFGATESPNPGIMYASSFRNLVSFNVNGTGATTIGPISGAGITSTGAEALAFCNNANVLYGALNGAFFSINPATGARIAALASPPANADVEGLACDHSANKVFGLVRSTGVLYSYSPGTNTWTLVGTSGVTSLDNNPGLAFDPANGVLYALDGASGNLYRIVPATAATTLVGSLGLGTGIGGGLGFVGAAAPPAPVPSDNLLALAMLALGLSACGLRQLRGRGRKFGR